VIERARPLPASVERMDLLAAKLDLQGGQSPWRKSNYLAQN
jgi:hypothetical protein